MDDKIMVSVANSFSITPGSRYKEEGDFSGEAFREMIEPLYQQALAENKKLEINLDGTLGYGTSFLEEVFGGLARIHSSAEVSRIIEIISNEEPYLVDDIFGYIEDANQ